MRKKNLSQHYDDISFDTLHEAKDFIYMAEKKMWEEYNVGESWETWWNNSNEKLLHDEIKKAIDLISHVGIEIL